MTQVEKKIADALTPVLERSGYRLVRAQISGPGDSPRLQIMAERLDARPITIDDCASISRDIGIHIDALDPIETRYTLEGSSPGVDRPLTRPEDFADYAGHPAKMELMSPLSGRKRFRGIPAGRDGDFVLFDDEDVGRVRALFADVARAKLLPEMKK